MPGIIKPSSECVSKLVNMLDIPSRPGPVQMGLQWTVCLVMVVVQEAVGWRKRMKRIRCLMCCPCLHTDTSLRCLHLALADAPIAARHNTAPQGDNTWNMPDIVTCHSSWGHTQQSANNCLVTTKQGRK